MYIYSFFFALPFVNHFCGVTTNVLVSGSIPHFVLYKQVVSDALNIVTPPEWVALCESELSDALAGRQGGGSPGVGAAATTNVASLPGPLLEVKAAVAVQRAAGLPPWWVGTRA
jgi:hypothetical protein